MVRVVKEPDIRRNEILASAQKLVYTKGYEQMTIQDILGDLQISKGAFYHYFASKQALLDGLINQILEQALQVLEPIINDPALPAIEKLQRYFLTAGRWKTTQKDFLLALLRVWYTDHNAIVRQKLQTTMLKRISPFIAQILRQGVAEGSFTLTYPDQTSEVVLGLFVSMGDFWAEILIPQTPPADAHERFAAAVVAYTEALERILGAPRGSLTLIDAETIEAWVGPPHGSAQGPPEKANQDGHLVSV